MGESPILSLVPSPPHLPLCTLARLKSGVAIHWADHLEDISPTICADLAEPLAAFTADGSLVLLGEGEGRHCSVSARESESVNSLPWREPKPLALVRAEGPNHFAVFTQDGHIRVFQLVN